MYASAGGAWPRLVCPKTGVMILGDKAGGFDLDDQAATKNSMNKKVTGRFPILLLLGLLCIYSIACSSTGNSPAPAPTETPGATVDSLFREFHQTLGGDAVLGRAITKLVERDGKQCQFTETALMCYDAAASDISRHFLLYPLGIELNLLESLDFPTPPEAAGRDLGDGFYLYPEFEKLYDQLYGALYVGRPLTQVRVNQGNQRYEQFFTNVGFYRNFSDPAGDVHLITYGAYMCGPECSYNLTQYWFIVESGDISQPFELSLRRLGWSELGSPLTQPYFTPDGYIEQYYDNVVLYAPQNDLSQVRFRNLPLWMGIPVAELVESTPHEQLVFYKVDGLLGHNVPVFFDHFIAEHGGRDLAGNPISEFGQVGDNLYQQCFETYCLLYDMNQPDGLRVRMAALGLEHLKQKDPSLILKRAFNSETIHLALEEEKSQVGANEQQNIRIQVLRSGNWAPLYLVESMLELTIPGQTQQMFRLRPTDRDGISQLTLPAMNGIPAMSVIEYKVCLNLPSDKPICSVDSFVYRGE